MFLLRILGLRLTPPPPQGMKMKLELGEAEVVIDGGPERNGARWYLTVARISLRHRPKRTAGREVVIPDRQRVAARAVLEAAANVSALGVGARRELSSPNPYVAFEAESDEERQWLGESRGIQGGLDGVAQHNLDHLLPLTTDTVTSLTDRWDGVALISAARTANRTTGSFLDYIRIFERAFGRAAPGIAEQLATFLDPRFGYTAEEIHHWTTALRGSTAHADQRRSFLLDSDVRPYLSRVEQAAWDILMNKARWRCNDIERRDAWAPEGGLVSASGHLVIAQRTTPRVVAQLLDRWQEFPLDLETRVRAPKSWWPPPQSELSTQEQTFQVVPREEWENATSAQWTAPK